MAIVVIGGHSRSVGKTSVVAGLIAALREFDWTAVKITQYGHGVCSANGEACDCATGDHSVGRSRRKKIGAGSRTRRAFWWRARRGRCGCGRSREDWPRRCRRCASGWSLRSNVMVESNSVLKFMRPDLYMTVLDPGTEDFKNSAQGVFGSGWRGDSA